MHLLEALILGIVQGLTEFLPISSSAHLRVVGTFLPSGEDPGAAFTAITQIGTEAAVVVFFWRDIVRIISQWFRSLAGKVPRNDPDARMGWLIIIGSIPIVLLGLLFQDQIETVFRSLWIVAIMLIVFGILLGIADHVGAKRRTLDDLTYPHGIAFGLAQALALIPGDTMAATGVAFVVALGVIAFFMNWISKRSFLPFVIYRILLGGVLLVLLAMGVIPASA